MEFLADGRGKTQTPTGEWRSIIPNHVASRRSTSERITRPWRQRENAAVSKMSGAELAPMISAPAPAGGPSFRLPVSAEFPSLSGGER